MAAPASCSCSAGEMMVAGRAVAFVTFVVGLLILSIPSASACTQGPAGEATWVPLPMGAYWNENPHSLDLSTVQLMTGQGAYVQPYNYRPVEGGPCVAAFWAGTGTLSSQCPSSENGRYSLGSVFVPIPDGGTHWSGGNLYVSGHQRGVNLETYHDDGSGHCVPLAQARPEADREWERCLRCSS